MDISVSRGTMSRVAFDGRALKNTGQGRLYLKKVQLSHLARPANVFKPKLTLANAKELNPIKCGSA